MPAEKAGQGAQAQNASTPAPPDKPTTAAKQADEQPKRSGIMDYLDIPDSVRTQVEPKEIDLKFGSDLPEEHQPPPPPEPEKAEQAELEIEGEDEEEEIKQEEKEIAEEEEVEEPIAAEGQPQKVDKRQKRINRLTRQKHDLEREREQLLAENDKFREQLGKVQDTQQEGKVPPGPGWLSNIGSEQELEEEVAKAQAVVDWCDANPEGVNSVQDGKEVFYPAEEVAKWRRGAEKTVMAAPNRRDQIRSFNTERQYFDAQARAYWPELFDPQSEEYQIAAGLLRQFPEVAANPRAKYAVGFVVEGMKVRFAQEQAKKNGAPAAKHRDLDERVFTTPRVPIAPHSPGPPAREATQSSRKKLNEAWGDLVKDPDGGVATLAKAFGAMEDSGAQGVVSGRTRVRS